VSDTIQAPPPAAPAAGDATAIYAQVRQSADAQIKAAADAASAAQQRTAELESKLKVYAEVEAKQAETRYSQLDDNGRKLADMVRGKMHGQEFLAYLQQLPAKAAPDGSPPSLPRGAGDPDEGTQLVGKYKVRFNSLIEERLGRPLTDIQSAHVETMPGQMRVSLRLQDFKRLAKTSLGRDANHVVHRDNKK
jgi:hypothetical protein